MKDDSALHRAKIAKKQQRQNEVDLIEWCDSFLQATDLPDGVRRKLIELAKRGAARGAPGRLPKPRHVKLQAAYARFGRKERVVHERLARVRFLTDVRRWRDTLIAAGVPRKTATEKAVALLELNGWTPKTSQAALLRRHGPLRSKRRKTLEQGVDT